MRAPGRALAVALLAAAAGLSAGCFTARPWRTCQRPCVGPQLERAQQVHVYTVAHDLFVLTDASAGEDERGAYLAGQARTGGGNHLGQVKVYDQEICVVRTRRVEVKRVAANVAITPVVVIGVIAAAELGADVDLDFDTFRDGPETWPEECQ